MIEKLHEHELLSKIPEDILEGFVASLDIYARTYPKGTILYTIGQACNTLDIVLGGHLSAGSLSEGGSFSTIFEFGRGDIVGANLLFGTVPQYPFNIYCEDDSQLLHITRKASTELLRFYDFVMGFVQKLSRNALGLNRKITMLASKTLRENLMEYLLELSTAQDSTEIVLPMSKKALADFLGVQRPSLFRTLKILKDEDIIAVENRKITLL